MREFLVGLGALSSVFLVNAIHEVQAEAMMRFGQPVQMDKMVSLDSFFENPESFVGRTITVQSVVTDSCTRMNCWMRLETPNHSQSFRIKVVDGEMVFPISTRGQIALATGVIETVDLSESQQATWMETYQVDEAPAVMYQLRPVGVEILRP